MINKTDIEITERITTHHDIEIEALKNALQLALKYIQLSPCEPDVCLEQWDAYQEMMDDPYVVEIMNNGN